MTHKSLQSYFVPNRRKIPVNKPLYSGEVALVRGIKGTTGGLGFYREMPANTLTDEILTPGEGKIRALIVHTCMN